MGSAKYFTSFDLCSGYWQSHIANEDTLMTTFLMRYGLYKWVVMPMWLTNTTATFMQTIKNLFSHIWDSVMAVFLDDILMYLCMVKEHFTLLGKLLACLHQYTFYCNLMKCSSITFLSSNITHEGMHISNSKV